jgi:hypothetical protein
MLRRPLVVIVLCGVLGFSGCSGPQVSEKSIAHETLSTGEVISRETWVLGDDPAYAIPHVQFYYQPSAAFPMEKIGQDMFGFLPDP